MHVDVAFPISFGAQVFIMWQWVYDFTAETFWAKIQTGQNINREKAYLAESQFKIKLNLQLK